MVTITQAKKLLRAYPGYPIIDHYNERFDLLDSISEFKKLVRLGRYERAEVIDDQLHCFAWPGWLCPYDRAVSQGCEIRYYRQRTSAWAQMAQAGLVGHR